jgi:hypothetical protein
LNVVVIVWLAPDASEANVHGNAVVHPPALLANAKPVGVVSLTVTFDAADGPLFATVIV